MALISDWSLPPGLWPDLYMQKTSECSFLPLQAAKSATFASESAESIVNFVPELILGVKALKQYLKH